MPQLFRSLVMSLSILASAAAALAQTPASTPTPAPVQTQAPVKTLLPLKIYPLPGGLDQRTMFNDNSPESVPGTGILVSTLPNQGRENSPFLDFAFNGEFGLFSHHLFIDRVAGTRLLYLGLVASNFSARPVTLTIKQGASYLSQPDAPFNVPLQVLAPNPGALIYAGPGDRVATELTAGKVLMQNLSFKVPPGTSQLIYSQPINTDVPVLSPQKDGTTLAVNGRSILLVCQSNGPLYLSSLAWVAKRDGESFVPPTLDDYRSLLNAGKFAGRHEPASIYDEKNPPKGAFFYGRVAGVSPGVSWSGKLWEGERAAEIPGPGEKVGYPIATTYVKRFGTGQNQSGAMIRRYSDSPPENHGNYGVDYQLEIPFSNKSQAPQTYTLSLTEPLNPNLPAGQPAEMVYTDPPNPTWMFRGSIRLRWRDAAGKLQDQLTHLGLHNGRLAPPFARITVPPGKSYTAQLSLIYPADATPPQLLTIGRE